MGYALGSVGLTLDDFCRLTPKEFGAACQSWRDTEERRMEDAWERMRLLAVITTQPHVKKKLEPKKLLPFPWEKPKKPKAEVVSREEAKKRFERLMSKCICQDC